MKDLLQKEVLKTHQDEARLLTVYLAQKEYTLYGVWEWTLHSNRIFCSDVMISLPHSFEGTSAIFHPDDLPLVQHLFSDETTTYIPNVSFRIITSYGEIKTIEGKNINPVATGFFEAIQQTETEKLLALRLLQHQSGHHIWQLEAAQHLERMTETGSWWLNTVTHEMYYSDGIFRIFGLPPQSRNAHLNTFVKYIHPDDHDIVMDAFAKSYGAHQPLHLQYRIITRDSIEKIVLQTTHCEHDQTGTLMLYGTLQNITLYNHTENLSLQSGDAASFHNRLLKFFEATTQSGHWYMNLLTRKVVFSDHYFRLYGLKPTPASGLNYFLNYVHPEDVDVVKSVFQKINTEHALPDIDYRIVRPDGKMRYLRQRCKLMDYGGEMVMACTIEDRTIDKLSERKIADLTEQVSVQHFVHHQAEEMAGMGSWLWDIKTGQMTWSESFYKLLGYKPAAVELSLRHLLRTLHPQDRKRFEDELHLLLQEKKETAFPFRMLHHGKMHHLIAAFKLMNYESTEIFLCTVQDVSKQEELQLQLTERMNLAETLTATIPDAVFITDENNSILLWNRQCEIAYQLNRDQVLYKNLFDVLPHLKQEAVLANFNQALKGSPVHSSGVQLPYLKGYYDILRVPMKNDKGDVTGILHFLREITKAHETELRLNERLNFIESLLEASADRIIVLDRHMNYLYCNQKAAAYYGVKKEDIVGKNVLEIFPDSMNKPTFEHFRRALRGETVHVPAIESFMDDHYHQVYLSPIKNDRGQVSAVFWMHHDLTHEIQLQRHLKKADEILNNISEVYVELDSEGIFRYANKQTESFWGKPAAYLIGKHIWSVFPEAVNSGFDSLINKALSEKIAIKGEYFSQALKRLIFISATPHADGLIVLFKDAPEGRTVEGRGEL